MSCGCSSARVEGATCKPFASDVDKVPVVIAERALCCLACSMSIPAGTRGLGLWQCSISGRPCKDHVALGACELTRYPNELGVCLRGSAAYEGVPWGDRVKAQVAGLSADPWVLPGCGCRKARRRTITRLIWLTAGRDRIRYRVAMGVLTAVVAAATHLVVLGLRLAQFVRRKLGVGSKAF